MENWSPGPKFHEKIGPPDQNSMENRSIVGQKFSGEDQFSMKKLARRTKIQWKIGPPDLNFRDNYITLTPSYELLNNSGCSIYARNVIGF